MRPIPSRVLDLSPARAGLVLPNELLVEIAFYLTECSSSNHHVQSVSSVSALSCVSRRIRNAILPQLFRSIPIVKQAQLHALRHLPPELLRHCRDLNVMMDVEFLVSMQSQEELTYKAACHSDSICHSLANILSKTPLLAKLHLATSDPSAWDAFRVPLMHARGISIDQAFQHALHSSLPPFTLPNLRTLSLHGIEGIAPLLRLAPNLESLHLSLSAGYALDVNRELVEVLDFVPKLKHLAYSPDTLRLQPPPASTVIDPRAVNEDGDEGANVNGNVGLGWSASPRGTADLLMAIGKKLPLLESLDLQTRWFSKSTYFCSSSEPILPQELICAMSYFRNLRHLSLPSNLASARDFALIRAPLCSISPYTIMMMPPSKPLIAARRMALSRDACAEQCLVDELFQEPGIWGAYSKNPERVTKLANVRCRLSSISFVRQVHPEDRLEYAVVYSRVPGGDCTTSLCVVGASGEEVNVSMSAMMELGGPLPSSSSPLTDHTPHPETISNRIGTKDGLADTEDEEMISLWEPIISLCSPWSSFFQARVWDGSTTSSALDSLLYSELERDSKLE